MREYTKEDLVQFMKWNSNAPMKVIRNSSVEELENFLKKRGAFDRFLETLDSYREERRLEVEIRNKKRALGVR